MKKLIILITTVISVTVFGQVGINTQNPKQTFHVDGKKDNPATGNPTETQQLNDVVITENGQIGVGKISPTEKIDVKGNIALSSDGNEASSIKFYENSENGSNKITVKAPETVTTDRNITLPSNEPKNGYVLVTDANGTTSWGAVNPSLTTLASIALKDNGVTIPIGATPDAYINKRFFQPFSHVVTDDNLVFDVGSGTYTAPQPGNYLITAYIVPNAAPSRNNPNFYYPVNLEVRKNCSPGDPNTGEIIMDNSVVRHATPGLGLRSSISVSGMVTLNAGDTLNLVVYLTGTNAGSTATNGIAFPANFTYANIATFKALFSVTAL